MIDSQAEFFWQGCLFFKHLVIALGTENVFACGSHLVKESKKNKKTKSKPERYCLLSNIEAATKLKHSSGTNIEFSNQIREDRYLSYKIVAACRTFVTLL